MKRLVVIAFALFSLTNLSYGQALKNGEEYPDDSRRENTFFFERYDADSKSSSRCFGLSVRPVLKSK